MLDLIVKTDAEIRGKEKKTSSQGGEYIIVRAEDERGVVNELCDKDMENFDFYKKGDQVTFTLGIKLGKFQNVNVLKVEKK